MKKITISILSGMLLIAGCRQTSTETNNKTSPTITTEEEKQDSAAAGIELNKGEKWMVDTNMMTPIRNMENDIHSFAQHEPKDYKLLANKLQTTINLLTSNCTMKGKAHDELHKWLLPFIDMANRLAAAKEKNEAEKEFRNIASSFTTFNIYFE